MQTFTANIPEDMVSISKDIFELYPDVRVFTLIGGLGSGKTTFVKAACKALDITGEINSPTFSIVHEYTGPVQVYHFDLYRLKKTADLPEIGFEEYFERGAYVFIEWPQIAYPLIDNKFVELTFEFENKNARNISCKEINLRNFMV